MNMGIKDLREVSFLTMCRFRQFGFVATDILVDLNHFAYESLIIIVFEYVQLEPLL
jgi:hypothetical protein